MASERCQFGALEGLVHANDRGPNTETSCGQGSNTVEDVESIERKLLLVASNPSLDSTVNPSGLSALDVERFFGEHGVFLDIVSDQKHRGECVGKLQDAGSTDERGQITDLGNCRRDNPSEGPVDRDYILISSLYGRK